MIKDISQSELKKKLAARTEIYAAVTGEIYRRYMLRVIDMIKGVKLKEGKPFSFTDYGYGDEATRTFREMYSVLYQHIRKSMEKEWILANEHNDKLIKSVFGEKSIEDKHFARYFKRNKDAMDALFARKSKEEGLNLSQRVWRYTGSYRVELENVLDLAIGEGTGANRMAVKVQQYLNDPDRFYRRFRVKIGEDAEGNPEYGRQWKRRVYDEKTDGYKWIDDNPKKYKPGRGVYRSSARNAQRLTRTETNISYRTADFDRWGHLDFVVGYEIRRSNNPYPCAVCESLKGRYPKTFKWVGWHSNCRCHMVPILATADEIADLSEQILMGVENPKINSVNEIKNYSGEFRVWIRDNRDRIATGTLPYFIRDNMEVVKSILS